MAYLWLVLSSACSIAANIFLKSAAAPSVSSSLRQMIPYLFALGIYGLGFGLYALALRRLDLSLAYPLMVGLSIVGVFLFATLSGTEAVSAPRICGAVLIMAGAFLVSK